MLTTSTRNGAYERLENGMGPARPSRKLPWKKIVIGCGALMGLVWFFGPRERTVSAGMSPPFVSLVQIPTTAFFPPCLTRQLCQRLSLD